MRFDPRSITTGMRAARPTPFLRVVKSSAPVIVAWIVAGVVTQLRPDPLHWIMIGALREDLRRIREEILDRAA